MNAPSSRMYRAEAPLPGNPALLRECLGSPDGLGMLGPTLWSLSPQPVSDAVSLRSFVEYYREEVLVPVELPAIQAAFHHTGRYQLRELLGVDHDLASQPTLRPFELASQTVGRGFLRRLRPLRDVRLLRRYEQAVQNRRAHGWHTLVYGIVLAIYSLPLRQGLLSYARHTLNGFLITGADRLQLPVRTLRQLQDDLHAPLPQQVQACCSPQLRCLPDHRDHGAPQPR